MKKETNNLKFKTTKFAKNGNRYEICVRLSDPFKNGSQDFAITGEIYKGNTDEYITGGAISDTISKEFPEFQIFEDLHLNNYQGNHTSVVANGFFILNENGVKECCRYLGCNEKFAEKIKNAENEEHFHYLIDKYDLLKSNREKAKKAIKLLEKWLDVKFIVNSSRFLYKKLSKEKFDNFKKLEKEGFYSTENLLIRKEKRRIDLMNKNLKKLKEYKDEKISKILLDYEVNKYVLKSGLSIDNFIFYNHRNEGVFNWEKYGKRISEKDFKQANLHFEGVTFKLDKI